MVAEKRKVEISADPRFSDSDIEELAREFEAVFQVHTAKYERFGLAQYDPILLIIFYEITKGFFEAIGKDAWEKIKKKLALVVSNRNEVSEVEFHYSYGPKKVELMVRSSDGNVVASAFDQIQETLEIVERTKGDGALLEFDSRLNKWVSSSDQTSGEEKVAFRFENQVAATVGSVTVRGRSYQLTEENLKELAKTFAGHYLKHEHSGPPIGRIEKAWYENGKLMVSGVVYEPTDERGRTILDAIKKGELKGFSIGFSFDSEDR